jgi:sugar (pentulose or hexulose) kinase
MVGFLRLQCSGRIRLTLYPVRVLALSTWTKPNRISRDDVRFGRFQFDRLNLKVILRRRTRLLRHNSWTREQNGIGGSILYLGIDIGTGGTRALIIDEVGKVVASGSAEHEPFASPQPGWAEQDPRDWWRACCWAVREVLHSSRVRADEIACVGFSGQMHGAVLLDAGLELIRNAIIWCDQRSQGQSHELARLFGADGLIRLTSNRPLTNFTLTKLLWIRESEPQCWSRTAHILLPKDYVRFRLTGEQATDVADASGTLLLDVAGRRWSGEVLSRTGIDDRLLPMLYESPQGCGQISVAGAEATGLRAGTPVVAGAGDQAAGAVSAWASRAAARSVRRLGLPEWYLPRPIVLRSIDKDACTRFAMPSPDAGT